MPDKLPELSCAELDALILKDIQEIEADIAAWEERIALQYVDDGKTTTERAQEALKRPERFKGEHAVATAWLRENARSIWTHDV